MDKKKIKISERFNFRAFIGDISVYSGGNVLLLIFGCIQILIIPKYLSVENYGYWKLFGLYSGYTGILHFGFIDGLLVRWAGKGLDQIGNKIGTAFKFLFFQQLFTILPLCLIFYVLFASYRPLRWISLTILVYAFIFNLTTFFRFTAQALRQFKNLTLVNIFTRITFLLLIIYLFTFDYFDYHNIIYGYLLASIIGLAMLVFWFRKYLPSSERSFSRLLSYGKKNIGVGIFILLGNFVSILFLSIDRLMVSSFFTIEKFAIYGFAVAIITIAYTFILSISQVFFPYLSGFSPQLQRHAYRLAKPAIILSWAAVLILYFPLAKLIEFHLSQYFRSLRIIQLLICTVGFGSLIQILHINYYKIYHRQREYFIWGVTVLAISAALNFLAIRVWGNLTSVAVATVISFSMWYVVNELRLKQIVNQSNQQLQKDFLAILGYSSAFWLSSFVIKGFVTQMLIYMALFLILTWFLFHSQIKQLKAMIRSKRC